MSQVTTSTPCASASFRSCATSASAMHSTTALERGEFGAFPVLAGRDVMHEPLMARRGFSRSSASQSDTPPLDATLPVLIESVKAQGLEAWSPSASTAATRQVCARGPMTLHLRESTVHEQFDSRDVAAIVGCEKHDGVSSLIGRSEPSERNALGDHLFAFLAYL